MPIRSKNWMFVLTMLFLWKKEERLFQKLLRWILPSDQQTARLRTLLKTVRNVVQNWFENRAKYNIIVQTFMNVRHRLLVGLNILLVEKRWILKVWAEKPLRCFIKMV